MSYSSGKKNNKEKKKHYKFEDEEQPKLKARSWYSSCNKCGKRKSCVSSSSSSSSSSCCWESVESSLDCSTSEVASCTCFPFTLPFNLPDGPITVDGNSTNQYIY